MTRRMTDLISRQDAIIALLEKGQRSRRYKLGEIWKLNFDEIREALATVPSGEPHWILCSERLPEDDTEVIVSCTDDSGDFEFSYTTTGWHFKGMWVVGNERSYFVRAWMPLPKPYEVEK